MTRRAQPQPGLLCKPVSFYPFNTSQSHFLVLTKDAVNIWGGNDEFSTSTAGVALLASLVSST